MNTGETRADAQMMRLLRLLERCGPCPAAPAADRRPGEGAGVAIVEAGGGFYRFAAATLRRAVSSGLAEPAAGRLRLRDEGRAWLRRALHPEAGYGGQHAVLGTRQEADARLVVNEAESPLARLRLRKGAGGEPWLDQTQFEAGERLRRDFERAGLQPRISANWEASVATRGRGGASAELSDFALDARRRVERALASLDASLAGVALDVCCFLKGLEQVERERRWPPRSAKLMLRTALAILARHYGLSLAPRAPSGLRHWGTEDFRPQAVRPPEPPAPRA